MQVCVIISSLVIVALQLYLNFHISWLHILRLNLYILLCELVSIIGSGVWVTICGVTVVVDFGSIVGNSSNFDITLCFTLDAVSCLFHGILVVTLIMCFCFLAQYFEYDLNNNTIIILSTLFSQLAYAYFCAIDLFLLICFWEWISIVSFFLINYWTTRLSTTNASLKVFCISQIGDYVFFISVFSLTYIFETTNINIILALHGVLNFLYVNLVVSISYSTIVSIGLVTALLLNSAQFIFFPWLLEAMEAPVPISAQLHSSTLVIIGFYVFISFLPILQSNVTALTLMYWFSFVTIISASVLGFFQNDGKKLLACSTASQLGYVVMSLSLGLVNEGLYLLVFCCCNKAAVFVWFGKIMDNNGGVSDVSLLKYFTYYGFENSGFVCSLLSATIVPGSFGWHVKGLLASGAISDDGSLFLIGLSLLSLTWFFSSLYLLRLVVELLSCNSFNQNKSSSFLVSCDNNSEYTEFFLVTLVFQIMLMGLCGSWVLGYFPILV